jgi:succinate dehydrogenase / fumarate reductase flavoprotein subunit
MSESLRNDGRVWVPKDMSDKRNPKDIPEVDRDYYLERKYPSFGNLVPRDVASRNAKEVCDSGKGVGATKLAVYLDFAAAVKRDGKDVISAKYGNLFAMYNEITDQDPYSTPMMIYPAVHYSMGGLWVDYNLMTTIPGLFALGEANFSDHGANRLGASALMQGLADGYFVIPYTLGNYLADVSHEKIDTNRIEFKDAEEKVKSKNNDLLMIKGTKTVDSFHRKLGKIMWDYCGMSRTKTALIEAKNTVRSIKESFWNDLLVTGSSNELNMTLEKANRVADFIELGELMIDDAINRDESCGGHFREEYQTDTGEAMRNDKDFAYVSAWQYQGDNQPELLNKENLYFDNVVLTQRSYK